MNSLDTSASDGAPQTLQEAVLQTLANAVISLKPDGVITTFNDAAEAITGLESQATIGQTFAAVFLEMKDAEDFTQTVFDSVYKGPLVSQRVVQADFGNGQRSLSMSVSRISSRNEIEADTDTGVAVVFEDITELRELRDEVDSQHRELRQAYVNLEEQNRTLAEAGRQTRIARFGVVGAVVVLLTLVGIYVLSLRPDTPSREAAAVASEPDAERLLTVMPSELVETVAMTGQLAPLRKVDITSPVTGKVGTVHAQFGTSVDKDDLLLELDVTETRVQHRDAEARLIKAQERLDEVENWDESVEVSRARQATMRAKLGLEDSRRRLESTAFLLENGVIPSSEHIAAQREYTSREFDLESSQQDLDSTLKRGESELRLAKIEFENARVELDELSEALRLSALRAPVAGLVMRPTSDGGFSGGQQGGSRIAEGDEVNQGERLVTIGDLDGISVEGRVDETDIVKIKVGDEALISSDAFAGTVLRGQVEQVSTEAVAEQYSLPYFTVRAVVPQLTPAERDAIRLGMSAVLNVVVRQEPEAILVPLAAINMVNREPFVRVLRDEETVAVPVSVGETTASHAEILDGIVAGDQILLLEG